MDAPVSARCADACGQVLADAYGLALDAALDQASTRDDVARDQASDGDCDAPWEEEEEEEQDEPACLCRHTCGKSCANHTTYGREYHHRRIRRTTSCQDAEPCQAEVEVAHRPRWELLPRQRPLALESALSVSCFSPFWLMTHQHWPASFFSVASAVMRFFSRSPLLPQPHSQETPPV